MGTLAELSLPVDQDTVTHALAWLETIGRQAHWPSRTLFKLSLCLDETLTNVTMYGYARAAPNAVEPQVKLQLREEDQRLVLRIMDNGVAFDPTRQTPRELDISLDDARIGGHGLRLMQHYLEDIRYERRNGWNQLELIAAVDDAS